MKIRRGIDPILIEITILEHGFYLGCNTRIW